MRSVVGNLVDVINGRVFPAKVRMENGVVVDIEESSQRYDRYLLPGLIDSHVHIESSLLVPSRFAEAAVPHGVTAVVADPHEIANVLGMEGVLYMMEDGCSVPMRFHFAAPSCVPATRFETSGSVLGWEEVRELMDMEEVVALGEMMDVPAVLRDDPDRMAKIEVARMAGKPIDGHAPGLRGKDLSRYILAGMSTDHECTLREEAEEKAKKGMTVQVREGSASRNMEELVPFARRNLFFLVTDDIRASDLMDGYMDRLLAKAVSLDIDPIRAVQAATIWPAEHYGLDGGALTVGEVADLVVVRDLRDFQVLEVYIGGELVAKGGRALFEARPVTAPLHILRREWKAEQFEVLHSGTSARVRVIEVSPDRIVGGESAAELEVIEGRVLADVENDVIRIAVLNRYREAPPALGFVSGFGIRGGAMASTIAHDSHNIVVVGTDTGSMAEAANGVSCRGGYFATDGERNAFLELPVAGLMSAAPVEEVVEGERRVLELVRGMGCSLPSPFMTLSFQCLLALPGLKISDRGLFEGDREEFVDLFL